MDKTDADMPAMVVNVHEAPVQHFAPEGSTKFGASIAPLLDGLPVSGLGAMFVSVEPGKRAFPFHNHLAMDEMFVILEGTGTYRLGAREYPVKAGDVCAAPKGGPETAHQLINTGDQVLKYLGISTMPDPDIVEYPDSGKFSTVGIAPGKNFWEAHLRFIGRRDQSLSYWDGEDL